MGKASSSKKVARAARTGGGRTKRGSSSLGWPVALALVVVLGTAGIVYSREQRQPDTSAPLAAGPGKPGDHWHSALGFDICGNFVGNLPDPQTDPLGIHTHGDGVVHTHPFSARAAGRNARLGLYFETFPGLEVTSEKIKLPGQDAKRNGMECDGKPAVVRTKIWQSRSPNEEGEIYNGDPADIRLRDNQLITIAFLPPDAEIRKPPSEASLDNLSDVGPQTTEVPPQEPTTAVDPDAPTTAVDPNAPPTTVDPNVSPTSNPPTSTAETSPTTTP